MIHATQGNTEILKQHKTAFLCSRKVPASVVLKCYDWAIEQREKGNYIISGFHSQLEKDVFHYLLKGKQPIIIALARTNKLSYITKDTRSGFNTIIFYFLYPVGTFIEYIVYFCTRKGIVIPNGQV